MPVLTANAAGAATARRKRSRRARMALGGLLLDEFELRRLRRLVFRVSGG